MKIIQSRSFENKIKKLLPKEKTVLDQKIKKICDDPKIGEEKKGDLKGIFIHKFQIKNNHYLLSYRWTEHDLELIMIGPHENYYRDLKTYLKSK